jgi:hypothetical protein
MSETIIGAIEQLSASVQLVLGRLHDVKAHEDTVDVAAKERWRRAPEKAARRSDRIRRLKGGVRAVLGLQVPLVRPLRRDTPHQRRRRSVQPLLGVRTAICNLQTEFSR